MFLFVRRRADIELHIGFERLEGIVVHLAAHLISKLNSPASTHIFCMVLTRYLTDHVPAGPKYISGNCPSR
jgi:hypothetical protein